MSAELKLITAERDATPEGASYDKGWKNALHALEESDFQIGDMIPMDWLHEHFRTKPREKCVTPVEYDEERFKFMQEFSRFSSVLLHENQLGLQNIRGEGYRILPPKEQTEFAQEKFNSELERAVGKAHAFLTNVRLDELSDEQRRQNADAQAKLSAFQRRTRKMLK